MGYLLFIRSSVLFVKKYENNYFENRKQILKLLIKIRNEAEKQITYYAVDKICDKLNFPVPSLRVILNSLKRDGYEAVLTHFNSRGIKTNAPANKITETITSLVPEKSQ
ncbi:MAG: DUF2067 family protein [Candidatus Bathyarchaeota archaeon]